MQPMNRLLGAATLLLALTAAPLTGAAMTVIVGGSGPRIEGSGNVVEEARALSGFRALVINGPADVVMKSGTQERVVVSADDNIVPLITTTVEDGRLEVGVRKDASFRTRNKVRVEVEFTEMGGITIRGSGDVKADRIRGGVFEVVVRGSGDIVVDRVEVNAVALSITGSGDVLIREGRADSVGVVIEGSGDARLAGVESRQGAVRIRGSGDAQVHVTEALQVDIAGSGDVRYRARRR